MLDIRERKGEEGKGPGAGPGAGPGCCGWSGEARSVEGVGVGGGKVVLGQAGPVAGRAGGLRAALGGAVAGAGV